MSRITLWGFYQFTDKKLFDNIALPQMYNKQRLIDLIMMECGDLYTYYQQPDFLKLQIDNFFARKQDDFARMYDALYSEYDPLENYDRKEDWTDNFEEDGQRNASSNATAGLNESVQGTATDETSDENSSSSLSKVSAMDSDTLVNDTGGESSSSASSNATTTNESSREQTSEDHRTDAIADHKENEAVHTGRVHGNIGVTTSMQLIEAELKLREYDLYERIVKLFEKNIIVQVY